MANPDYRILKVNMKNDPYNDFKIYHKAKLMNNAGQVSPLCANKPRPINFKKESWTTKDSLVTCKKCLKLLKS